VYVICECTNAGIWTLDTKIASAYLDQVFTEDDFITDFVKTGKALPLPGGRYFFRDFIIHQYPKGLTATNPAHKNIIIELRGLGLIDESLKLTNAQRVSYTEDKREVVIQAPEAPKKAEKKVVVKPEEEKPKPEEPGNPNRSAKKAEDKEVAMLDRMQEFKQTLTPYIEKYGQEMLDEFYAYWSAPNKSRTKFMREQHTFWSLPGRLATWAKKSKGYEKHSSAGKYTQFQKLV